MDNQDMTEEEFDKEQARQIRERLNEDIRIGKALAKLRKMPEFKEVFDELNVTTGKKFLWENVIHVEEELMKKHREETELERGKKVLKGLK